MEIPRLTFTALPGLPMVQQGDDLGELIHLGLAAAGIDLQDGDVLILAQKIVSKAEGRQIDLSHVQPGAAAVELAAETGKDPRLVELIVRESRKVLRTREDLIIVEHRLGFVCANAGIDRSNVEQQPNDHHVLLLPEDADASAAGIRDYLENITGMSLAVLIIDSHGRAWRNGTVGTCIGAAGFPTLVDMRGWPDIYGRELRHTEVGLGDEIAAGASALMGQAAERMPVVHLRGLPYSLRAGTVQDLIRPEAGDLFR